MIPKFLVGCAVQLRLETYLACGVPRRLSGSKPRKVAGYPFRTDDAVPSNVFLRPRLDGVGENRKGSAATGLVHRPLVMAPMAGPSDVG